MDPKLFHDKHIARTTRSPLIWPPGKARTPRSGHATRHAYHGHLVRLPTIGQFGLLYGNYELCRVAANRRRLRFLTERIVVELYE